MGNEIYFAYIAIILVWNFAVFATPYLAYIDSPLAKPFYGFFSYTCHQLPDRSLYLFGHQFPVCARDTAFYLAMLIGGFALPFFTDTRSKRMPHLLILVIAIIPLGIDGLTQLLGWRESTNLIRIITGGVAGLAVPFYLVPVLNLFAWKFGKKQVLKTSERRR